MPDEATQAPETETQDTPAPVQEAAVEETTPAEPTVDYRQRYESLVPEYTKGQQLLAAARGDHGQEAQMQALQQLGVEVQQEEAQEEDFGFEDPDDRINKLEQKLAQREEAEQAKEAEATEQRLVNEALDRFQKEDNTTLSDAEKRIVKNNALANRFEFKSVDDLNAALQGAYDDLKGIKSAARDEYLASKKAHKVPAGAVGEEEIDLSDKKARDAWIAKDYAARMAEEGS